MISYRYTGDRRRCHRRCLDRIDNVDWPSFSYRTPRDCSGCTHDECAGGVRCRSSDRSKDRRGTGWSAVLAVGGVFSAGSVAVFAVAHLSVGRSAVDIKPTPTTDEGSDSALPSVRQGFSAVLRNRNVVLGAGVAFVAYSLSLLLNSWLPTYLLEEFALSPSTSGLFAAVFPAMGVVSRAGGGLISDRLFGHQRLPVLKWPVVFVNSMYPDFREPVNTPPVEAVHSGERAGWRNARRSTDCASNPGAVTNRDTCTLSRTDNTGVSV